MRDLNLAARRTPIKRTRLKVFTGPLLTGSAAAGWLPKEKQMPCTLDPPRADSNYSGAESCTAEAWALHLSAECNTLEICTLLAILDRGVQHPRGLELVHQTTAARRCASRSERQ